MPVLIVWGIRCRSLANKESEMSEGVGLIERFYKDVMESGNLALIDEMATDSYVDHEEGLRATHRQRWC